VAFAATVGTANSSDINQESAFLINKVSQAAGMTNVQQVPAGPVKTVQGKNFQQMYGVVYTASMQTNQGTTQVSGLWITLFNSASHIIGFVDVNAATNDALIMALPDAKTMVTSMF
jgi:hypothetical protein